MNNNEKAVQKHRINEIRYQSDINQLNSNYDKSK